MKKRKRIWTILIGFFLTMGILIFINFIPTFNLKSNDMSLFQGKWIDVYYEKEARAAKDVFDFADAGTANIASKLGFKEKQDVRVFIYDDQKTMQEKKYGLIGPMLGLDWYIGDNMGTDVILTSPANPGPAHTYEDNKEAVLHEIVHAYISVINPKIHLWLNEGMALYLSNGEKFSSSFLDDMAIPGFQDTQTSNPITFSNMGGYTFAHTYIEYLDKEYGWNKVLELFKTEDYETVFGKRQEEIYDEWVMYIRNYINC